MSAEARRVELGPAEVSACYLLAAALETRAKKNGYVRPYPTNADGKVPGPENDIYGQLGECAGHKALGVYWPMSVDTFHGADLGDDRQIRTRSGKNGWDLCIRDEDDGGYLFHLVLPVGFPHVWDVYPSIRGSRGREIGERRGTRVFVTAAQILQERVSGPDD